MTTVLQEWVEELPWKWQSILFSGLRGPDSGRCESVKTVSKWMRQISQNNADPSKGYMVIKNLPEPEDVSAECEYLPCHFVHHLADALAVIAYAHPFERTRKQAFAYHVHIAEEIFHFLPEDEMIFRWRHRDKIDGKDPEPNPPWDYHKDLHVLLPEGFIHA